MCGTMKGPQDPPRNSQNKSKRKNTDKRKEKSRDAARDRRFKESQLFKELEDLLPMSGDSRMTQAALDKTSLIRLTLANLKCRDVIKKGLLLPAIKEEDDSALSGMEMLEGMDAFCLVMSKEMEVVFVSNTVETQIGINALELMGQSFCDYVHPCDHHQLKTLLSFCKGENKEAYVRVKVTVTERGRMINLRQANYKVLKISGIVRKFACGPDGGINGPVFLGLAQLLARDTLALNMANFPRSGVFQTKHAANMTFAETDQWLTTVGQYPVDYLLGMSFYEFIHVEDSQSVQKAFRNLCDQGQCETEPYRLLLGGGGWVWVQTRANLVCVRKGRSKGNSICCNHAAISEVMNRGDILALVQVVTQSKISRNKPRMENVYLPEVMNVYLPEVTVQETTPENVNFYKVNPENVYSQKRNIGNVNSQKVDNLVTLELIPEVKSIDEIYGVFQLLDEEPIVQPTHYEEAIVQPMRYEDDILSLTNSDDIGSKFDYPTPSVIVEPKNPPPKVSTECLLRRSSVIVTSPATSTIVRPDQVAPNLFSTIVRPDQVAPNLFKFNEESSSKKPHAVTNVLFDHTEEPLEASAVYASVIEPTIVNILPERSEDVEVEAEDEAALYFAGVHLDLDGSCDLEQLSPSSSDDFVEVHLQQIPLLDFSGEKEKSKETENQRDNSEEFFKILSESNSPTENNPDDRESSFVKNNSQIMWGLDEADSYLGLEADPRPGLEADPCPGLEADPCPGLEADPCPGLETCFRFPQIYNQASTRVIPPSVYTDHFQYKRYEEKMPAIANAGWQTVGKSPSTANAVWQTVGKSPPAHKPTIPPKICSNESRVGNRKRSSTWINANVISKSSSTIQFPELQKLLEGQSLTNDAATYCGNSGNSRVMDNPKHSRLEYRINCDDRNTNLSHNN